MMVSKMVVEKVVVMVVLMAARLEMKTADDLVVQLVVVLDKKMENR